MDEKKNEDYIVQMPDGGRTRDERDAFMANSTGSRRIRGQNELGQSFSKLDNSPPLSVLAYCLSSISMTVVNKYVVSGTFWNLNFFYLAIQVCLETYSCPVFMLHLSDCSPQQGYCLYCCNLCV